MACPESTPCNQCPECLPAPTPLPDCVGGEPCEEVSKVDCVSYMGPNLPALGISYGDRMSAILGKLHKVINPLIAQPIPLATYVATNTATGGSPAPLVVTYLGLGPVYTSAPGATSTSTTITTSTTGLAVGMTVEVIAGVGAFAPGTTVASISSGTSFTVSQAPTTALSGGATIIRAVGSDHQIFTISVAVGNPQSFKAFVGSPVKVSGTGTVV